MTRASQPPHSCAGVEKWLQGRSQNGGHGIGPQWNFGGGGGLQLGRETFGSGVQRPQSAQSVASAQRGRAVDCISPHLVPQSSSSHCPFHAQRQIFACFPLPHVGGGPFADGKKANVLKVLTFGSALTSPAHCATSRLRSAIMRAARALPRGSSPLVASNSGRASGYHRKVRPPKPTDVSAVQASSALGHRTISSA